MNVVLPVVAMAFFSVLYTGLYVWMRRPKFGESEKLATKIDSQSMTVLSHPIDDHFAGEHPLRDVRDGSGSQCHVVTLKKENL